MSPAAHATETAMDAQRAIVDSFKFFGDWTERYQYLVDLGRSLPAFPEEQRQDANKLHGCQSGVWLHADVHDGKIDFVATSDSAIVAGLVALLLKVYSGRTPKEILSTSPTFVEEIGLAEHLSPHRANGLALMLERIRTIAVAHACDSSDGGRGDGG